jgi:hypothetical protein
MKMDIERGKCFCGLDAYITVIQWEDVKRVFPLCLEHGQGRLLDDVEDLMMEGDKECIFCGDEVLEDNWCDECERCEDCCECD